jgi:hypothetical protein
MRKDITLFRAINQSKQSLVNLAHVKNNSFTDVKVLYDCTNKPEMDGAFNFTIEDYRNSGYYFELRDNYNQIQDVMKPKYNANQFLMWQNAGYCVLLWYLQNPDYDFYYSVEHDVYFNGNWDFFYEILKPEKADFIGTMLKEMDKNEFFHLNLTGENFKYKVTMNSFGCYHRYSNRLLKKVHEELLEGNHAFYETIFPSIAKEYKMSLKDLNDNKAKIDLYTNESITYPKVDVFQMVHRAGIKNKLLHRMID